MEENQKKNQNQMLEDTKEEIKVSEGGANESKSQPVIPVATQPKPLTLNDVKGIDELYDAYLQRKAVELPPWIIETDKGPKIYPQELFIHIIDNYHILSVKLGNSKGIVLYKYNDKGYYELWTESEAKAFIKSFLPRKLRKPSDWELVFKELITEAVNTEESDLNVDEDIINFENGILDLTTGKMLSHNPKYLSTIQIPCNYIENAKLTQAPLTNKFLQDITGRNPYDISTILEVIGLVISNVPGWRYKQLLILKGPGDTGKSVLREFVTNLLRKENCFTVDIALLNSRFGTSGIVGKRLVRKWRYEICTNYRDG